MKNDHILASIQALEEQKKQIDAAIGALRSLLGGNTTVIHGQQEDLSKLSVYKAVVHLLEKESPLSNDQIFERLSAGGKSGKRGAVISIIYKEFNRMGKNSKIAKAGKSMWKLA